MGAGTAVGGTTVAVGAAAGAAPQAAKTSEVNNNTNSEPICKRFNAAPFHLGDFFTPMILLTYTL
jgi:hypothetical protein